MRRGGGFRADVRLQTVAWAAGARSPRPAAGAWQRLALRNEAGPSPLPCSWLKMGRPVAGGRWPGWERARPRPPWGQGAVGKGREPGRPAGRPAPLRGRGRGGLSRAPGGRVCGQRGRRGSQGRHEDGTKRKAQQDTVRSGGAPGGAVGPPSGTSWASEASRPGGPGPCHRLCPPDPSLATGLPRAGWPGKS